jgi:hypothetical protein
VFRHATDSPGALDTSPLPPLSDKPRSYTRKIEPGDCREEMRTKLSLVRVCALWWHVAIGFLYEFVWIWKPSILRPLIKALGCSSVNRSYSHHNQPLGWYVKRIWISTSYWKMTPAIERSMKKLFDFCSDIQILGIRPAGRVQLNFDTIAGQASTLRFSHMEWESEHQFTAFFYPLLHQLQQLGALEVLHMTSVNDHPGLDDHSLDFPLLHTLCLIAQNGTYGTVLQAVAEWTLPSLRYLLVDPSLGHVNPEALESILASHGLNLNTLIIKGYLTGHPNVVGDPDSVVLSICTHCPDLRDLSLDFGFFPSTDIHLPILPHLSRITTLNEYRPNAPRCKQVVDCFLRIMTRPCLIRLPHATFESLWSYIGESEVDAWTMWRASLSDKGVQIEGEAGVPI